MTHTVDQRKTTPSARRPRDDRYVARRWLWDNAGRSANRVRACGLRAQGSATGEGVITLRVADAATDSPRAGWSGLQSCGSTWACPVCAEKIQAKRNADVAAALAVAKARGLVVGFLTFTVRHKRRHALTSVWAAVSHAWRATTSGSPREWTKDRDTFGIAGYLRLTEVTHGDGNGWHVHIHALVFLRPHGRPVWGLVPRQGPEHFAAPWARPVFTMGPLTQDDARRAVEFDPTTGHAGGFIGPLTLVETKRRTTGPGSVREVVRWEPCPVAQANAYADAHHGREPRLALYDRDLQRLSARMFRRWRGSLAGTVFEPDDEHGTDARLVTDHRELAAYFAKHVYGPTSLDAAAAEVTGSYRKVAKRGNVTPFGLLQRIVNAPAVLDESTGELVAAPAREDLALWHEWEAVSKGKRQLLWSNGLRAYLGLAPEETDEEVAAVDDEGRNVAMFDGRAYRRIAFLGLIPAVMAAAEAGEGALYELLLPLGIPWTAARPPDDWSLAA